MPANTAKPVVAALGILVIAVGMLFKDLKQGLFYPIVLGGAALLVVGLYAWLTSPLEEEY